MSRYHAQAGTFLAPASVDSASIGMRPLSRWLLADTEIRTDSDATLGVFGALVDHR